MTAPQSIAANRSLPHRLALLACLIAFGAWLFPAQASAAATPAWKLTAVTLPTNLAPGSNSGIAGPLYFPVATNVGAAPTTGTVVVAATLPIGITPVASVGLTSDTAAPAPTCTILAQTVTCETAASVHPGHWLGVRVGVNVAPTASGVLVAQSSVSGGGADLAETTTETTISPDPAPYDFLYFDAPLTNDDGSASTVAGSRPEQLTVDFGLPVEKVGPTSLSSTEHPHTIATNLPRGVIINPTATPVRCTEAQLTSASCPIASQVGLATIMSLTAGPNPVTQPIYNMVPPPGAPASLGFDAIGVGIFTHLIGGVRSDGDYGLSGTASDILARGVSPILGVQAQLWGDPTGPSHDQIRECPDQSLSDCPVDPAERTEVAFLTMPTDCPGQPLTTGARANSWEHRDLFKEASYQSADLEGNSVAVGGCDQLEFKPTIEAQPTTNLVDSPSGLDFDLHQPQDFDLQGFSTAALKDAIVTLPEGMTANPSQADGLVACSPQQVGLTTPAGQSPIHFTKAPANCPDAAKLGSVQVSTPLLEDPLPGPGGLGAVYLAQPFANPFDSLLAIYIVLDDPQTGTVAKLAGEVIPDPVTGRLSTRFEENPQLPLEDVKLRLFTGPRAPLITPGACATHTIASALRPWSSPAGADVSADDSFEISATPSGGDCPASEAQAPNKPTFSAGTITPRAGAYSPFLLRLNREDGSQRLKGLDITLPPGLSGKIAGIPACPDAAIEDARARTLFGDGALEQANPSCPVASQLGTVTVGAGAGPQLFYAQGRAYLAGPYKGAPLSAAIITPAVAGPFDLGVVVVRAALNVDPVTAQITAVSDPVPTILAGITLDVRSATVRMDRPQFTLNPTSCDEMSVKATAISVFDQSAHLSSRFQVGGCADLPFKPKLALRLFGGTRRAAHPSLRAVLTAKPGEANIARAVVSLPRSEFLDQSHIRTVCTRVQFAADQCPKGSIYGRVRAFTPLLDEPLEGPIYLRSSSNELPDMVAVLKGPADRPIEIEAVSRIDSVPGGGIRANLDTVPDAPIRKVVLTMQGGRKGLLINSTNLCAKPRRATVKMDGQNGKFHDFRPVVRADCKPRKKAGRHHR